MRGFVGALLALAFLRGVGIVGHQKGDENVHVEGAAVKSAPESLKERENPTTRQSAAEQVDGS